MPPLNPMPCVDYVVKLRALLEVSWLFRLIRTLLDVLNVVDSTIATRIGGRWRQVEFMCQEKKVTNSTYDVCRN
jgi:hypothetical protein